jgi:hypothetical protein
LSASQVAFDTPVPRSAVAEGRSSLALEIHGDVDRVSFYAEHSRRIERVADRLFEGEEAVLHVIERIVAPLGLWVGATSPWVDARLPDGSRVQTNFLNTPLLLVDRIQTHRTHRIQPGTTYGRGTGGW